MQQDELIKQTSIICNFSLFVCMTLAHMFNCLNNLITKYKQTLDFVIICCLMSEGGGGWGYFT